jgi:hypothetical protein
VDGLERGRMMRILSSMAVPKRECLALGSGRAVRAEPHAD